MTDRKGDRGYYLTRGIKWDLEKNGLSPKAKPFVADHFSRTPESRESNSIPVS